jgi:hypothetical protein
MTKLNWIFIISVVFIIFGAILTDISIAPTVASVFILVGGIVAGFSGIFSLINFEVK